MATSEIPKHKTKIIAMQALGIGLILLVALLLFNRGKPERLIEFEFGAPPRVRVYGGSLYWAANPSTTGTGTFVGGKVQYRACIAARPVTGGPERVVAAVDARFKLYTNPWLSPDGLFAVWNRGVYFGVVPKAEALEVPRIGGGSVGGVFAIRRYLGEFAPSTRAARTGAKRRTFPALYFVNAVHLLLSPALRGSARDLRVLNGTNFILLRNHALWTQPQPGVITEAHGGNDYWTEVVLHNKLMWTDLETGTEQCVHTGVTPTAPDSIGEAGAFWTEPRPFPDNNHDLYYVRAATGAVLHLGQIAANEAVGWSVEWKGSLYWFVGRGLMAVGRLSDPERVFDPVRLMSADLANASPRSVFQMNDRNRFAGSGQNLFVWHDALYCLISDVPKTQAQASTYLERIHPGRRDPLEIVQKLPPNLHVVGFESGYLYYIVTETKRTMLATLTDDDALQRRVDALYRVRLPD